MSANDLDRFMWHEALRGLDQADRLQRQFFSPSAGRRPRQWEPPVDIFETREAVYVTIALPGVPEQRLTTLQVRGDELIVAGERAVPAPDERAVLHRLEIPHGRFVRRVPLPYSQLRIAGHNLADGCLYLTLNKR